MIHWGGVTEGFRYWYSQRKLYHGIKKEELLEEEKSMALVSAFQIFILGQIFLIAKF